MREQKPGFWVKQPPWIPRFSVSGRFKILGEDAVRDEMGDGNPLFNPSLLTPNSEQPKTPLSVGVSIDHRQVASRSEKMTEGDQVFAKRLGTRIALILYEEPNDLPPQGFDLAVLNQLARFSHPPIAVVLDDRLAECRLPQFQDQALRI